MEFQCGLSLEFQRVVIIFITLSQPLHPEIFSTELLRRPVLIVVSKRRPVFIAVSKRRLVLIAISNRRPVRSVVFKEKTEEEEQVSLNQEFVLLENLEVSMIISDED